MTLGHVHIMCMLLAIKFLLAVDAAISPEFMHWYPHPDVSATPHRACFTVLSIPIRDSTNKMPEAHRSIVAGKAASRGRFHVYLNFCDCGTVCGSWRLTLSLAPWPHEVGKKRTTLSDLLNVHVQWKLEAPQVGSRRSECAYGCCHVWHLTQCLWSKQGAEMLLTRLSAHPEHPGLWQLQMDPAVLYNPRAQEQTLTWACFKKAV